MGAREEGQRQGSGNRGDVTQGRRDDSGSAKSVAVEAAAPNGLAAQEVQVNGPTCRVGGEPVVEMAVLFKPSAFFVTTEHGTHEITRCYFQPKLNGDRKPVNPPEWEFSMGHDTKSLHGLKVESAEYTPERGLLMKFTRGYELFVPGSSCQATWRR